MNATVSATQTEAHETTVAVSTTVDIDRLTVVQVCMAATKRAQQDITTLQSQAIKNVIVWREKFNQKRIVQWLPFLQLSTQPQDVLFDLKEGRMTARSEVEAEGILKMENFVAAVNLLQRMALEAEEVSIPVDSTVWKRLCRYIG